MPEEHEDRRERQRIGRQRSPADRRAQACQPDEQRRPHDGRLRPHERHVEPRAAGDSHQGPATGQGEHAEHLEQRQRQKAHVQSRDRQDVDRAGDQEFERLLPRERLPTAEQQGRRQRRPLGRKMTPQHLHAAVPQTVDPGQRRPCRRPRQHPHALRRMGPYDRQAPQRLGTLVEIEFVGIERRRGPHPTAEHPHAASCREIGRLTIHDQRRPSTGRPPRGTTADSPHRHHAFARGPLHRSLRGPAPQRVDDGGRQPPGRLLHDSLDCHRLRRQRQAPGKIVAGEQVGPNCRPASGPADDRHQKRDRRPSMPPQAGRHGPPYQGHRGSQPPDDW